MKIVFTGDLHLGASEHMGPENTKSKTNRRFDDFLNSFDQIVDYVVDPANDVGVFIIAGDIYKTNTPSNRHRKEFATRLVRLSKSNKDTYIIDGNHDVGVHIASAIAPISALSIPHVHVYHEPITVKHVGEDIGIAFIPYLHKEKIESINNYIKIVDDLYQELDATGSSHKLLIGHQTVEGSVFSNTYSDLSSLSEIVVPQQCLAKFDLAVYGHIHKFQVLGQKKNIIIPGSIDNSNLGEIDFDKKFIVYDTVLNKCETVQIKTRKVYDILLNYTKRQEDIQALIMKQLEIEDIENSIVQLTVKLTEAQRETIDEFAIKDALNKAWYSMGYSFNVERKSQSRNENVTEQLEPLPALEEYLKGRIEIDDIKDDLLLEATKIITYCDNKE